MKIETELSYKTTVSQERLIVKVFSKDTFFCEHRDTLVIIACIRVHVYNEWFTFPL